ncbi:hypothetical protein [Legionella sp. CNM-4043-24]|uniref:hypothetical protein n=1 Tax=Legionella sp. CNM-4043-24 TaxID=3421646 RepID=UPI00403A8BB0
MPDPSTHLDLSKQELHLKLWQETVHTLASIGEEYQSLDLSNNFLGDKAGEGLGRILKTIPMHVTTLNLSTNHLFFKAKMYSRVIKDLGKLKTISSLSLSQNGLYQLSKQEFSDLLSGFSPTLRELDLSHNDLYRMKKKDRPGFDLLSLPPGVTRISLASNYFDMMDTSLFAQALSRLPQTLRALSLAGNNLDDARIKSLFPALRLSNIHELNTDGNPEISESTLLELRSILEANQLPKPLLPLKHSESERYHFLRRKRQSAKIVDIDPRPEWIIK